MRFIVSSTTLNTQLQTLAKVIASKPNVLILDCFLFEVGGGKIKVTASDNENVMYTQIAIEDEMVSGRFAVNNHTILSALRDLPEQPLTFDVDTENNIAKVLYQNGMYTLAISNAEEYPETKAMEGEASIITISGNILASNITRTIFATAQDEARPVMNGIFFDLGKEALSIVASDGHKLVRNRNFTVKSDTPASFILPKKPANLLKSILEKYEGDVVIKFNASNAEITFGDSLFLCRLIEGRYPNYNSIIPAANPNQIVIDRKQLMGALRRMTPFSGTSQLTRFHIDTGKLELKSEDVDFATRAEENIGCTYNGMAMKIGFKGTAFAEILANIESDEVNVQLSDPVRAGVIVPSVQAENEEVLVLIMPILLND